MRHDIHVSAFVPAYHRHLDLATIANAYLPRLQLSFSNLKFRGSAKWLDGGAVSLALTYEAALKAEHEHHNEWLNAAFIAAQDAGLHIAEAYVTRSVGMA